MTITCFIRYEIDPFKKDQFAEFAEQDHPARLVAQRHMQTLRSRLQDITQRLDVPQPEQLAAQLAVLVNGAFASSA